MDMRNRWYVRVVDTGCYLAFIAVGLTLLLGTPVLFDEDNRGGFINVVAGAASLFVAGCALRSIVAITERLDAHVAAVHRDKVKQDVARTMDRLGAQSAAHAEQPPGIGKSDDASDRS